MPDSRADRPGDESAVHTFGSGAELPRSLALDITFVASCLIVEDLDHAACSAYLRRLTDSGTVLFFTDLTELQLHDVARALRSGKSIDEPATARSAPRGRLELVPPAPEDLFDRWRTLLASTEAMYCELPEVIEGMWSIMTEHDVDAARAASVSLVHATQADGLLTTDEAYGRFDSTALSLFVPDRRAGAFRCERSPRSSR